jgi:hypothetical protein
MRALSASQLLDVWERGQAALPIERALYLLSSAIPESSSEALALLSIGQRDAQLLQLREWAFGHQLVMTTTCPSCCQALELAVPTSSLRVPMKPVDDPGYCLQLAGYAVRIRPLNSEDIASCAGLDAAQCRRKLLMGCVTEASFQGDVSSARMLPESVFEKIEERIAEIDPQADVHLNLVCPECNQARRQVFDIVSFFWMEIDAWARGLLLEVSVLARVFGWHERDILELSPARRQIYLAMAQA